MISVIGLGLAAVLAATPAAGSASFGPQVDETPRTVAAAPAADGVSDVYDYGTAWYACTKYGWDPGTVVRCQWSAALFFNVRVRPVYQPGTMPGDTALEA